jgi:hypothetical protein
MKIAALVDTTCATELEWYREAPTEDTREVIQIQKTAGETTTKTAQKEKTKWTASKPAICQTE